MTEYPTELDSLRITNSVEAYLWLEQCPTTGTIYLSVSDDEDEPKYTQGLDLFIADEAKLLSWLEKRRDWRHNENT